MSRFIVVMGVSGCGKTTLASALAEKLGGQYLEGDSFHPPQNKEKMGQGIPLQDSDRWPWFDQLRKAAIDTLAGGIDAVLACSALKTIHRDYLLDGFPTHRLIHLAGDFELIKERMDERDHEYMTSELLKSQFEALEAPAESSTVLELRIDHPPDQLVAQALSWLGESDS